MLAVGLIYSILLDFVGFVLYFIFLCSMIYKMHKSLPLKET